MSTLAPEITFEDIVEGIRASEQRYEVWMTPLGKSKLPCLPTVLCDIEDDIAHGYWEVPNKCQVSAIKIFDNQDRERTLVLPQVYKIVPDDPLTVSCPLMFLREGLPYEGCLEREG